MNRCYYNSIIMNKQHMQQCNSYLLSADLLISFTKAFDLDYSQIFTMTEDVDRKFLVKNMTKKRNTHWTYSSHLRVYILLHTDSTDGLLRRPAPVPNEDWRLCAHLGAIASRTRKQDPGDLDRRHRGSWKKEYWARDYFSPTPAMRSSRRSGGVHWFTWLRQHISRSILS